jgi:PHD/YefM family antitoxin component YafN of YafNO toxin-antitoxin module
MRERDPMTQIFNVTEARKRWSEVLGTVFRGRRRVILEKSGIPVAALISPEDFETYQRLLAEREARFAVIDRIRERNAGADPDQVYREVTEVVEAVRQERYDRERASQSSR